MSLTRSDIDYVEDPHTAGRAYLELRHELDHPDTPQGRRTEAKAAMNKLETTWPDAAHHAATASEDQLGGLPAHLKRTRDEHRRQRGVTAQSARQARQRTSHPSRPAASTRPASRRSSSTGRRRSRSGPDAGDVAEWAAPGAVDLGALGWQVFGWGVGLSMAYLLLTNSERAPRGQSAVELVARGAAHTVDALVSPLTDPLTPRRTR
ncbi:MAG: hypothetical protein ACJ768_09405 [Gaiellaceae bacterium]